MAVTGSYCHRCSHSLLKFSKVKLGFQVDKLQWTHLIFKCPCSETIWLIIVIITLITMILQVNSLSRFAFTDEIAQSSQLCTVAHHRWYICSWSQPGILQGFFYLLESTADTLPDPSSSGFGLDGAHQHWRHRLLLPEWNFACLSHVCGWCNLLSAVRLHRFGSWVGHILVSLVEHAWTHCRWSRRSPWWHPARTKTRSATTSSKAAQPCSMSGVDRRDPHRPCARCNAGSQTASA